MTVGHRMAPRKAERCGVWSPAIAGLKLGCKQV